MLRKTFLLVRLICLSLVALCLLGIAKPMMGQDIQTKKSPSTAPAELGQKLSGDIEEVLWWLPEETEGVLVSKGKVPVDAKSIPDPNDTSLKPQIISTAGRDKSTPPPEPNLPKLEYQELVAGSCTSPLEGYYPIFPIPFYNQILKTFYTPDKTTLFVTAVWWEKDETRVTCEIVLFKKDIAKQLVDRLARLPSKTKTIRGVRVLEIDLHHGIPKDGNPIPFDLNDLGPTRPKLRYLAAPRPNVYIATTSPGLMEVFIDRMRHRGSRRALAADLPEWQYVDTSAMAWGLRHYRPETAKKDPLSMLKWDPNAQGLVLFGGNKPQQFIGLRYVSSSEDADKRFLQMQADWFHMKDPGKMPPMRRIGPKCVESRTRINVPLKESMKEPLKTLSTENTLLSMQFRYLPWLGFSCPRLAIRSE
ncbi:MAG: hypothetical protein PVH19_02430 [Planctomycetia bacterium]|jgi:hypothetical protein